MALLVMRPTVAWHIQHGPHAVLFDAGQTDLLVENAARLGVSLDHLDAVVLSQGHYDHAGGVTTLRHIRELTAKRPAHTVLGGFRLLNASGFRLDRTVDGLRELDIRQLGPAHCTGMVATARVWS